MTKKRPRPTTNNEDSEFSQLFWQARESHRKLKKNATAGDPEHKSALNFAKAHGWPWAESLLEADRLYFADADEKALNLFNKCEAHIPDQLRGLFEYLRAGALRETKRYDEAIKALHRVVADPKFDRPGLAWISLGLTLKAKGNYDEAIKTYHRALEEPNGDTPGNVWFNIGLAYYEKGEPAQAIAAYHKALEDPNYGDIGWAWNNLGNALKDAGQEGEAIEAYNKAIGDRNYSGGYAWYNLGLALEARGEYPEAIEAYRKALAVTNFDRPGYAWNNLGNALSATGAYAQAIKAYLKALDDPNYDTPAKAWVNLADSYLKAGKRKEAESALKNGLATPDPQGADHAKARATLLFLRANMRGVALSPDDRALAEKFASSPAAEATEAIESGIIGLISGAGESQYEKYLTRPDSTRSDTLSILRGWSSAVTLLEGSERRWRGGGYFLKWRGCGVVIDPGFDFLRNFHDAGYHGREIDAVVVSHNHPDHNFDLKALDDLRYELFKRLRARKEKAMPYVLVWDRDTDGATRFPSETADHRYEPVPLTSALRHPIDLLTEHDRQLPLRIIPFKVQHETKGDVPHAMGMVIELLDKKRRVTLRLGYTGDTGEWR